MNGIEPVSREEQVSNQGKPDPQPEEKLAAEQTEAEAEPQAEEAGEAGEAGEAQSRQEDLQETLEALRAERDELKERFLRLAAETENYKKRSEREKAEFLKRSNQALVKELLPVLDNLERALAAAGESQDQKGLLEGLELTRQELWKVLERHGLERVEALGQTFDPEYHEAMMQQEDPEVEENTVLQELQKGYLFQGRLLRPAMVVVSKKPTPADDEGTSIKVTVN